MRNSSSLPRIALPVLGLSNISNCSSLFDLIGAGVPLTTPRLYSGGTTDDIRVALMYISTTYPKAPLLGIGFSLGANVLTRYLAEEGTHSRLNAGCVLGSVSLHVCDSRVVRIDRRLGLLQPWNFVDNIEA